MNELPEDLMQYVRSITLEYDQQVLVQELSDEYTEKRLGAAEYVERYVKRKLRIQRALSLRIVEH